MAATIRSIIVHARAALLSSAAVLLLMGMGGAPKDPQISIEGASASLSGMFLGAGSVFFTISNTGGRDELLSASVDIPGTVTELHGVAGVRMFKMDKIAVPASGTVELKPGSNHIMIFNMPKSVQEGSEATLTLTFQRSGDRKVRIRFEKSSGMQGGY